MGRAIHIFARENTLRRSALASLLPIGAALAGAAVPLGAPGVFMALAVYLGIGASVLRGLDAHRPSRRFGAANSVTAARAAVASLLFGAWIEGAPGSGLRLALTALAAVAFLADGLDGYLARRGTATRFGARFDMETDALLVLALSLLVHAWGQAGAFVLLSGAMRYLYGAARWVVPALRAPLAPSVRRQSICVAQTGVLIVAMAPPVPASFASPLCAAGLVLLIASFAIDCAAASSARARTLY